MIDFKGNTIQELFGHLLKAYEDNERVLTLDTATTSDERRRQDSITDAKIAEYRTLFSDLLVKDRLWYVNSLRDGQKDLFCIPRTALIEFSQRMEAQLRANDHKTGWSNEEPHFLLRGVYDKADMVEAGVDEMENLGNTQERRHILQKLCADIANYAMMVADRLGAVSHETCDTIGDRSGAPPKAVDAPPAGAAA